MDHNLSILYIGAYLPRLSETFVYREVLELRKQDCTVYTASLHKPDKFDTDQPELQALSEHAIVVYNGWKKLLADAGREWKNHTRRAAGTLWRAWVDSFSQNDATLKNRLVLPGQALAALALAHRVRKTGIRHIHAHMAHSPTTLAMYTARQLDLPFSFTGHAADLFRDRAFLTLKLKRSAFTACISHWHRHFYQQEAARPDTAYPIVRCGVDPDAFSPDSARSPGNPPRILAVGRMVQKKGFDVLIRALDLLHRKQIPFQCSIVGDGDELPRLKALCGELNLTRVIDFPGACSNPRVNHMMKEADLFVLPCRISSSGDRDGIPVVLMEAMASECCVVSGDLPTIRELVHTGETGFMVEPENIRQLADTIEQLLLDAALRSTTAKNGRQLIEKEFSLQENVRRLKTAFVCEKEHPQRINV